MLAYTLRRLAFFVPMLIGIAIVVFALMHVIPGDPARVLLGDDATPEAVAQLRATLGLDQPWPVQLMRYFARLASGDFGRSMFLTDSVANLILARLPATLEIAILAVLISVALGVGLGVAAAVRQGSPVDVACMMFAQLGVSMPVFWLGILLMYVFAVELRWVPSIGRGEALPLALWAALTGAPQALLTALGHLAMPALTLGLANAAVISRLVRASMLEVLSSDFVRTARAKGMRRGRVVYRHALRNAMLPVITVIGWQFGALLSGAVLTEGIFGWPGLGQLAVNAISQRDIPLVQGVILTFALVFAVVNLAVDLLYCVIDPRVRLG
jgi:peptide/nickel transport system permease protein